MSVLCSSEQKLSLFLLQSIDFNLSIWIDKLEGRLNHLDCILGMGDNTASMGWLRRSNFREKNAHDVEWLAKQKIARKLAEIVLETESCLYRQWFKGAENAVADSLSRDSYYLNYNTHCLLPPLRLQTTCTSVQCPARSSPSSHRLCCYCP